MKTKLNTLHDTFVQNVYKSIFLFYLNFTTFFQQTIGQWRIAFWTVFIVLVGTNLVYVIWGSGEPQWWDDVDKYGYPSNWKHGPLKKREVDGEKKVVYPKHDHSPVSND